jgi:large subunit ribosomal protein L23
MPQVHEVLIRPLITEKFSGEGDTPKYCFEVSTRANKIEIARAVAKRFTVTVVAVNTVRHAGKIKSQMTRKGRFEGRTPQRKKAVVTLLKGQKIDFFAGSEG